MPTYFDIFGKPIDIKNVTPGLSPETAHQTYANIFGEDRIAWPFQPGTTGKPLELPIGSADISSFLPDTDMAVKAFALASGSPEIATVAGEGEGTEKVDIGLTSGFSAITGNFFIRAIVVILGFLFVGIGLRMFSEK